VKSAGAAVDELLDELGQVGASGPLGGEVANLLLRGNLTSQEQPEETFRKRLLTTGGLGKKLLALGDSEATETDTLLRIEDGALPDKALYTTGTTVGLVESKLANDRAAVFLSELLDFLELTREFVGKGVLERLGLAGRVAAQAIEGSGLYNRLTSKSAGAESRGTESKCGSHI
jgi:hypothetical protein